MGNEWQTNGKRMLAAGPVLVLICASFEDSGSRGEAGSPDALSACASSTLELLGWDLPVGREAISRSTLRGLLEERCDYGSQA